MAGLGLILSMYSDIALFMHICCWLFSCLQKLCAINVAKVSFLNRDHKNGESVCLSPFLWSLFRKKTFSMFIAHTFWRHRNVRLKMYMNKAITTDFDKINTYPTIDQFVYISIVEPYWFVSLMLQELKKVRRTARQRVRGLVGSGIFVDVRFLKMSADSEINVELQ